MLGSLLSLLALLLLLLLLFPPPPPPSLSYFLLISDPFLRSRFFHIFPSSTACIYSLFIPSRVFSLCPCIFYPPCTTFLLNSSFFFFFFFRLSKKFSSSSFNVSLRVKRINSSTRSSSIRDFGEEFYSHW